MTVSARVVACAVLAVLLLVGWATPATAAEGSLGKPVFDGLNVSIPFESPNTEAGVEQGSVRVQLDGRPVEDPQAVPLGADANASQVAVLAIDVSGSMAQDGRLASAKEAALRFLDVVPAEVEVALVTFADTAETAIEPTLEHDDVRARIAELAAAGDTALYDAVVRASGIAASAQVGNVILLTDGENDVPATNTTQLSDAIAAVQKSEISLDAVPFPLNDAAAGEVRQLVDASQGGSYNETGDPTALIDTFQDKGEDLGKFLSVTFPVPPELVDGAVELTVQGMAAGEVVQASRTLYIGSPTATPSAPPDALAYGPRAFDVEVGPLQTDVAAYAALALLFTGLLVIGGFALYAFAGDRPAQRITRRLSIYTLGGRRAPVLREATVFGQSALAHGAVQLGNRIVAQRNVEGGLLRRLEAAGVPLRPAEWVVIHLGVTIAVPLVVGLITAGDILLIALSLILAVAAPWVYLSIKESRRRQRFTDMLPDTLQLLAGSLSTGYSLGQAADSVVREGSEPVASEFNRALIQARLGMPVEDALAGIADRMRSQEWGWVVLAIRIQREVGGNLAELLSTVADTLRERARLHRQVRVLSAEGRLSAWILGLLPVVFFVYLLIARRSYVSTLFTDPLGWAGLILVVVLLTVGGLWLRRLTRVEV